MRIIIDDDYWTWVSDSRPRECKITGEMVYYWHCFKNEAGESINVSATVGDLILEKLCFRNVFEKGAPADILIDRAGESLLVTVEDRRTYYGLWKWYEDPDYEENLLDHGEHWVSILPETWYQLDQVDEKSGIFNYAMKWQFPFAGYPTHYGYNNMVMGERVLYKGEPWYIVHVSRIGLFGLAKNPNERYSIRVWPKEVCKVEAADHT